MTKSIISRTCVKYFSVGESASHMGDTNKM